MELLCSGGASSQASSLILLLGPVQLRAPTLTSSSPAPHLYLFISCSVAARQHMLLVELVITLVSSGGEVKNSKESSLCDIFSVSAKWPGCTTG